jgi:hypothetical protein
LVVNPRPSTIANVSQAVEKHAAQREAIQKWLATIPETLEGIQRLSDLHRKSPGLHQCANDVLVAVFFVLERIVDKLTQSWKDRIGVTTERTEKIKGLFKKSTAVTQHTGGWADAKKSVDDALNELKVEIERFQKAVDICAQERLGRIEDDTTNIKYGTLAVAKEVMGMYQTSDQNLSNAGKRISSLLRIPILLFKQQTLLTHVAMNHSIAKIERFMQGQQMLRHTQDDEEESQQKVLLQLQNIFYKLCASNPHFDSKTGGSRCSHSFVELSNRPQSTTKNSSAPLPKSQYLPAPTMKKTRLSRRAG